MGQVYSKLVDVSKRYPYYFAAAVLALAPFGLPRLLLTLLKGVAVLTLLALKLGLIFLVFIANLIVLFELTGESFWLVLLRPSKKLNYLPKGQVKRVAIIGAGLKLCIFIAFSISVSQVHLESQHAKRRCRAASRLWCSSSLMCWAAIGCFAKKNRTPLCTDRRSSTPASSSCARSRSLLC